MSKIGKIDSVAALKSGPVSSLLSFSTIVSHLYSGAGSCAVTPEKHYQDPSIKQTWRLQRWMEWKCNVWQDQSGWKFSTGKVCVVQECIFGIVCTFRMVSVCVRKARKVYMVWCVLYRMLSVCLKVWSNPRTRWSQTSTIGEKVDEYTNTEIQETYIQIH